MEVRTALGMAPQAVPWAQRPRAPLRSQPQQARIRDCIDVCFEHARQKSPLLTGAELVRGLWCNPGQSVARLPYSRRPATFSSSLEQYSYEKDCALSGEAHLNCAGWPYHMCPNEVFSNQSLRTLAADSFRYRWRQRGGQCGVPVGVAQHARRRAGAAGVG